MFHKGEYIVYGSSGVCEVVDVGRMDMSGAAKGKLYYTLLPVYSNGSRIYTPVDNEKIAMRTVLSKEEALGFVEQIPEIEPLWVSDEKKREEIYSQTMKTCSHIAWTKIIKTLYLRQKTRLEGGKRLASVDERYLKLAEDSLYGELAIALGIEKEEVEKFIVSYIDKKKEVAVVVQPTA